jgi:translation initiation factor IF-2
MTPRDDRFPDMPSSAQFDAAIEQVLRGDAVGDDAATFARFVDDMRVIADRPPPPPSPALAALLAGSAATCEARSTGVPSAPRTRSRLQARSTQPAWMRWRSARLRPRVALVPIAGKAAVVLAVATTAAAGAAAGILPEPATHFVRRAIEVVTPFELPGEDATRPEHAHQRADPARSARVEPGAGATPPQGSRPAVIVSDAGVARGPDVETNADPQSEPNPTDEAPSSAKTYPEPDTSAWPTTPNAPASSPPPSRGPKRPAPPDAGSGTEPAPKTGHIPPGHVSPGTPRPGGPGAGDAPLSDPDPTMDRPGQPAGKGRPARPGSSGGSSSNPARVRPQHGPPPDVGTGTGSNEEAPTSGPPPAAGHGPSVGSGRDHDRCGQPRGDALRPADCGPWTPPHPGRGPRSDTGSAQGVGEAGPEPAP